MLAVGKIDSISHAGPNDRFAELFVILVMKFVLRELALYFVTDSDKKCWDVVPEKIDKLIVRHNDQNIRFGLLQVRAQNRKRFFSLLTQLLLLLKGRPGRR